MKQQGQIPQKVAAFKAILLSLWMLVYGSASLFAQQGTVAAGGSAFGTGGTATYSTGLVSYITATGTGGNINQGLQHASSNVKFIPGKIEAENWDTKFGPQYAIATTDAGGGQQVVGITNGSWMDYNVTVTQTGAYTVYFRVGTPQPNAQFQIKLGINVLATITIPNTGEWDNWQTIPVENVQLTAGAQIIRIQLISNSTCNFNWTNWVLQETNIVSTPFGGTRKPIPGRLEAEEYDNGGQNVAYLDGTTVNSGGAFRPTESVDTRTCPDIGGGYCVGWTTDGEWVKYSVNVTTTGTYTFTARIATPNTGKSIQFQVDGNTVGTLTVQNTGGFNNWQTATLNNVSLATGDHVFRFLFNTGNAANTNLGFDINWFNFALVPNIVSTPFGGTRRPIPGKLEAEEYDNGGQNVAYLDGTTVNSGGAFRPAESVDTRTCPDIGGGYCVGWTTDGEWVKYSVNVTTTGTYTFTARIATPNTGKSIQFQVDGNTVGTLTVQNTGGFNNWQTATLNNVSLIAGDHVFRFLFNTGNAANTNLGFDINWFNFTLVANNVITFNPISVQKVNGEQILAGSSLEIFPNPVTDQFALKVNNDRQGSMKVQVFDQDGRVRKEVELFKNKGVSQSYISAADLPAGMYILRVQMEGWSSSVKMLKL